MKLKVAKKTVSLHFHGFRKEINEKFWDHNQYLVVDMKKFPAMPTTQTSSNLKIYMPVFQNSERKFTSENSSIEGASAKKHVIFHTSKFSLAYAILGV